MRYLRGNYVKFSAIIAMTMIADLADAQAAPPVWRLEAQHYEMSRTVIGTYATHAEALAAMKGIVGPSYGPDVFSMLGEVKSSNALPGGLVEQTYWQGKKQAKDPDWSYSHPYSGGLLNGLSSESSAVQDMYKVLAVDLEWHECSTPQATPISGWYPVFPDPEWSERYQDRDYNVSFASYEDSDGVCHVQEEVDTFTRVRRFFCPEYTEWSNDHNACVNEDDLAFIIGPPQEDSCPGEGAVGNPCDVRSGAKTEVVTDINLPWVELVRSYSTAGVGDAGVLGHGWRHNHQVRLYVDGASAVVQEGMGAQRIFQQHNGQLQAIDASGDVLVDHAGQWLMRKEEETLLFNAAGQLVTRTNNAGDALTYAYDETGLLVSVSDQRGRSLLFVHGVEDSGSYRLWEVLLDGQPLVAYQQDASGRLAQTSYADNTSVLYHYENASFPAHLTGVTREDGQRFSTFTYDAHGRATSSQHAGGVDGVWLSYANGSTSVTDALGLQSTYTFSQPPGGRRRVAGISDFRGSQSTLFHTVAEDPLGRIKQSTDRLGTITAHAYAQIGSGATALRQHTQVQAQGLPEAMTRVLRHHVGSNRLVYRQLGNLLETWQHNGRGQVSGMTSTDTVAAQSRHWAWAYCEQADVLAGDGCAHIGALRSTDGPRTDVQDIARWRYYTQDAPGCAQAGGSCAWRRGDLYQHTDAAGNTQTFLAYDAAGRLLHSTDANGLHSHREYSPRGQLLQLRLVDGSNERITQFSYLPGGRLLRVTRPDGSWLQWQYDAAWRPVAVADAAGNRQQFTRDAMGNIIEEQIRDAGNVIVYQHSWVYDAAGRLVGEADAAANPVVHSYDVRDLRTGTTNALGVHDQWQWDGLGRLVGTIADTAGLQVSTAQQWDVQGNLASRTDPKGLLTTYLRNAFGEVLSQYSPDTGTTSWTYDSAGNPLARTDARGQVIGYIHDAVGRQLLQSHQDPGQELAAVYDVPATVCPAGEQFAAGRVSTLFDGGGQTHYCYNRFGDVVRKVQQHAGSSLVLRYRYHPGGTLAAVIHADGTEVDYVHDSQGQVRDIGVRIAGGSRQLLLAGARHAPFGPVTGWQFGNGRTVQRLLDQDYRVQSVADDRGQMVLHYSHDAAGQIVGLQADGFPVQLDYDSLGRLQTFRDGATGALIEQYSHDATGNRLQLANAGLVQNYSYPADSHRLTAMDGMTRSHDATGNTSRIGSTRHFEHDARSRLVAVRDGSNTVLRQYAHNALGQRIAEGDSSSRMQHLYDEGGQWLGQYSASGVADQQVIWLGRLPVGVVVGGQLHYIQPDHLGSPRLVVDPQRDVGIWRWDLRGEAFGSDAPAQDPDQDGVAFRFDLRFPGQRYDPVSGLNYNYFRDYEPATGRYLQSDPIGLEGGWSTYGYVGGNPVSYADPLGLLTVRAYVNRGGGRGNEWRYTVEFNPFSLKNVPGWGGALRRGANRLETAIDAMKPGGIGPKRPVRDYLECGELDGKVQDKYEAAGYKPGQQLTRTQAEQFLNSMYLAHPEMRQLYDLPRTMLDNAEAEGIGYFLNSLMDQAHPGEL